MVLDSCAVTRLLPNVVELGAGAGLVGCLAAQLCNVLLTDGNETVVSLLEKNAARNRHQYGVAYPYPFKPCPHTDLFRRLLSPLQVVSPCDTPNCF
jgi:methylase of polypeptide subunit release factors